MSTVSVNLREAMRQADMNADKLGAALGHSDGRYIRAILAGRKYPSSDMLARIAAKLGVTVEELTRLPGPRPPA